MAKKMEIPLPKPLRKIAIVGTAPSSCLDAPYDDESWEIWSLGCNVQMNKRFTRWFEMHTERVLREAKAWDDLLPYWQKMGDKLMVGHPSPAWPDAKKYPIDDITAKFGRYFTSSISYMLALAIHEGADVIGLWGIDMVGDEEYGNQRPCCEYFLGIARGMNIELVIADESPLLRHERLYGFERCELSAEINTMRIELKKAIKDFDLKERESRDQRLHYEGQMAMLSNIHKRFG